MKVKCPVCNKEVELKKEEIQKYVALSKTGKVKPSRLIKLLDIYEGDCLEGEEHAFTWDKEFLKNVEELKGKQKGLGEKKVGDEKELDNVKNELVELRRKIEEGEKKEKDLVISIDNAIPQIRDVEENFENITGTKDLNEWK